MFADEFPFDKIENSAEMTQDLFRFFQNALENGSTFHDFEEELWNQLLQVGNRLTQAFLDAQGFGDLGDRVTLNENQHDEKTVVRLDKMQSRPLRSIFGSFEIERIVYGTRKGQKIEFVPLDTRLELPESKFSYLLQNWSQQITTEQPYGQVSKVLQSILGFRLHVDSLERMSRKMSPAAEAFCWDRTMPAPEEEGEIVVVTADGKGVPIRREADAPRIYDHQPTRGPKRDRKRMATVASIYSVDRHLRLAEDVVNALFRTPDSEAKENNKTQRPRPCHKWAYACLDYQDVDGEPISGRLSAFGWLDQQLKIRVHDCLDEVVLIMDGQESLWEIGQQLESRGVLIEILDLLHVTPRLWTAASLFHDAGSDEAEKFVKDRVTKILHGNVSSVIRGLRRLGKLRKLSNKKAKTLETICTYFEKNKDRMKYDKYLSRGYPIASGVIEGACRHLVKDRLERTGMTWTRNGAQAMLNLRAITIADDWQEFQVNWIETETVRLYQYKDALKQQNWAIST